MLIVMKQLYHLDFLERQERWIFVLLSCIRFVAYYLILVFFGMPVTLECVVFFYL